MQQSSRTVRRKVGTARWTALVLALVAVAAAACDGAAEEPPPSDGDQEPAARAANNPHIPTIGPWFEGWYTRITDEGGSRSFAVIGASHLPAGVAYQPGMRLPGYLAVLISDGGRDQTFSFEAFPEETYVLVDGRPLGGNVDPTEAAGFEWVAAGYGSITADTIDIALPGEVEVRAATSGRVPWNSRFTEAGPEGILAGLPLPLHWHVDSLGSHVEYEVTIPLGDLDLGLEGRGFAHREKNWGSAFPVAWIWAQGIDRDNDAQFVLGGGDVAVGPTAVRAWIAGYRSPEVAMDFNFYTPGTLFDADFDACAGTLTLEATDPLRRMVIEATAPEGTFGPVSIPTADGFASEAGGESFSATVTVSVYRHDPVSGALGGGELVEQREFRNAALEFGAGFACGS